MGLGMYYLAALQDDSSAYWASHRIHASTNRDTRTDEIDADTDCCADEVSAIDETNGGTDDGPWAVLLAG